MIKIGLLSFSDGRERVHNNLAPKIEASAEQIREKLENGGNIRIVPGKEVIWRHSQAREQAQYVAGQGVDGTILNVPVFAFPNLARIACQFAQGPFLAFSPSFGGLPGLGGMLGSSCALEQVGIPCDKVYGSWEDENVLNALLVFCRTAHAINGLRGRVLGLIGGRSIGMVTGEASPDLYNSVFGLDVDHIDQLEIVRRSPQVAQADIDRAYAWLENNVKNIEFDDKKLTPETLKDQLRNYYATKSIIEERELDFVAVKCHYEMSEYYFTQCLGAAFMNDPYDWDGKKEPFVFACEADADAAVTMQILKLLSGKPVIFTDLRHYDAEEEVMVLCNCGAMSTWYTRQSDDPAENLKDVSLAPVIEKYGGNGCHVKYIAGEGQMTFARLFRQDGQYHMTIFTGTTHSFPEEKMQETCPAWPHLYSKLSVPSEILIPYLGSNHIHCVAGDYVAELVKFCELKGIVAEVF
jgi:L-fucose isomerase